MAINIGFTGTRAGMSKEQKDTFIEWIKDLHTIGPFVLEFQVHTVPVLHHGDCVGADADAHKLVKDLGGKVIVHPPIKRTFRAFTTADEERPPKEYLRRNDDIVKESSVMIACPKEKEEQQRSGTWYTIRQTRKAKKALIIIYPDGTWEKENL